MRATETPNTLGIGKVAELTGVSIQTLRFYERRGLLKEVARRPSGYRDYTEDNVRIISFIKRAQELGFTLTEIAELLWIQSDGAANRKEVQSLANAKITDIENRIINLKTIGRNLAQLVDSCTRAESTGKCPILDTLKSDKKKGKGK